jgi:hypothetical protein
MRPKAAKTHHRGHRDLPRKFEPELPDRLGNRLRLLDGLIRLYPTIQRCKNTVFKYFRLSLKPVLQLLPLFLASRFVKLLGARTHLSLYHAYHQSLLFLSTCFGVQP